MHRVLALSSLALVIVVVGCGSSGGSDGANGDNPFGDINGGSGGSWSCVPDVDAGVSIKSTTDGTGTGTGDGTGTGGSTTGGSTGDGTGTSGTGGSTDGSGAPAGAGTPPSCPPGEHAVWTSSGGSGSGSASGTSGSGTGTGSGSGSGGTGTGSTGDGSLPPMPSLCKAGGVNNEPDILVGYAPASGQTVGATGQIKVWVNDEGAPIIAPNEQIDPNTGVITQPGDRTAKASDGYLWEPALYIAPATAEKGGTPHFPSLIKGSYNNQPSTKTAGSLVAGMDPPPPGSKLVDKYTGEDIWDVSSLGLGPGTYIAEFVIHDGDRDRAIGCVTITIQ